MAGDWIKVQHALPDKPEVVQMASLLGIDQDSVTGKLIRLWIWADQQTTDGNALTVTDSFLDRVTFAPGFGTALRTVGWLTGEDGELCLPNFDRHNGTTAKTRANGLKRVQASRSRNAATVTKSLQERNQRRKENRIEEPPETQEGDRPSAGGASPPLSRRNAGYAPSFREVCVLVLTGFNEAFDCRARMTAKRERQLKARLKDVHWRESWESALLVGGRSAFLKGQNNRGWSINLEFFLKPDTVTNILEGKYDGTEQPPANSSAGREQRNADAFAVVFGNGDGPGDPAALQHETGNRVHAAPTGDVGGHSGVL
jgi:hypothetical protein